jgi:predicted 3-demethylubiquinone-9 3-methyltransferase (glyoxalase superfamily)
MSDRFTPCLWFNGQAEEAAAFYVSCFPNSRITHRANWPPSSPFPEQVGKPLMVEFELDGQAFLALNGGMDMAHSMAISLLVNCDSQAELDLLNERLTAGGQQQPCGWLADRYGVHWQLVPRRLLQLLREADAATFDRVFAAELTMSKLDLAALEAAAGAKP